MTEIRKNIGSQVPLTSFGNRAHRDRRWGPERRGDQRGMGTWSDFSKTAWRLGGRKGGMKGGKEEGGLREGVGDR